MAQEGKYSEMELLFIEEVLDQHGEFICDLMREQIENKKLIKDEDLLNSIDYKVSHYGINPVLLISFMAYGRFIEINYFKRSQNSRQMASPGVNLLIMGSRENRKRSRKKDTRWYAKTAYGSVNRLIAILSNEFTEAEKTRLQTIITRRNES